jgi:hypothetical protein
MSFPGKFYVRTVATLDRGVAGFIAVRETLKSARIQARKALPFYGPSETGGLPLAYIGNVSHMRPDRRPESSD